MQSRALSAPKDTGKYPVSPSIRNPDMGDWETLLPFPYGCLPNCKRAHYHVCNQEQERDSHTESSELLKSEGAF